MTGIRAELLAAYADEHREHLAGLRSMLSGGEGVEEAYRHAHSLKGAARAVGLSLVEAVAHRLETLLQAVWDGETALDGDLCRTVARAVDAIEDLSAAFLAGNTAVAVPSIIPELDGILDGHGLDVPAPPEVVLSTGAGAPVSRTLRVDTEAAGRLVGTVAGLLTQIGRHHQVTEELRRIHAEVLALQAACRSAHRARGETLEQLLTEVCAHSDRVAASHDAVAGTLVDMDWSLGRLADCLQDEAHHLRLVSADSLFAPYGPMVREIAADQGKEVVVEFAGLQTRADRDVLQPLTEAVMHLLRNAVIHGIETPERRLAAGKGPAGRVAMEISAAAGRLDIRIIDDGAGLDLDALARGAAERGIDVEGDPAFLRRLVFEPGLSTAGAVTAFAGRGMGMSIVRQVIDRLQGSVTVEAGPGGIGTVFALRVPVTVMAQRLVLVRVRDQVFALPSNSLRRLAEIARSSIATTEGASLAEVDGKDVRLMDLGKVLGLAGPAPSGETLSVAVLEAGSARLGLVVDEFIDARYLPVSALSAPLRDDAMLAGVVTLEDGRLVLVLGPSWLMSSRDGGALAAPEPAREPPLVLVVDDSLTTRTLEKSILEAHGYRVRLAVDGRQALEMLAELRPQVVVSDIEMPRLDGFGLLAAMKRKPDLRDIPVVLVTSRDSKDDRERGMRLGAAAYIVKTRFDQDDLLDAIGRHA